MSQLISLQDAIDMTTLFRQDREAVLATAYQNNDTLPKCETFDRSEIESLLAQQDCEALRIYYGMDSNNKVHAILVGVDSQDEDILTSLMSNPVILEQGRRCPTQCPPPSSMNS